MSHLRERKENNCLNCQTEPIGRYCHVCGQENLEPKETVWHLIQHFFNDITHFDGKFFETVKYLLKRPGFLSYEYMRGRRMSYLNPIRMYVFTSAIFFIILFSLKKPEDMARVFREDKKKEAVVTRGLNDLKKDTARLQMGLAAAEDEDDKNDIREKLEYRTTEIAAINKAYGDTTKRVLTNRGLDSILFAAYADSLAAGNADIARSKKFKRAMRNFSRQVISDVDDKSNLNVLGYDIDYNSIEQYDSTEHALPDSLRDGWLKHFIVRRSIVINQEWKEDRRLFTEHLLENIFHSFPKILFISLPIFAMILNILYFRHKQYYYVDHGIFTIHVYCATFILLLLAMLVNRFDALIGVTWVHIIANLLIFAICLWMMIYLYKAMRGFYMQRRAKTFLKYFITFSLMGFINLFLLIIFLLISVFSA